MAIYSGISETYLPWRLSRAGMSEATLEGEKIHLWRGERHVLRGVSFGVTGGELPAIDGAERRGQDESAADYLRPVLSGGWSHPLAGRGRAPGSAGIPRGNGLSGS